VGGPHRLRRGPAAGRPVLRRDPPLLARPAGRRAGAGLCGHPPEDRAARRAGAGLHGAGARHAWRARLGEPVRHREPRPDGLPRPGRPRAGGGRHGWAGMGA
jgi:hypothetical protein